MSLQRADELLLGRVAVEPHQRRVGADHPAVERRAEHALADIVVEVAEASLRRAGAQQRAVALQRRTWQAAGRDDGRGKEPSEQALPSRPGRQLREQHDGGQGEEQGKRKRRRDKRCMCDADFVPQRLNDGYARRLRSGVSARRRAARRRRHGVHARSCLHRVLRRSRQLPHPEPRCDRLSDRSEVSPQLSTGTAKIDLSGPSCLSGSLAIFAQLPSAEIEAPRTLRPAA